LDESGAVDFYLENYHEFEGQAQYDAWISGIGEPYDFTGSSYLEEWTRPLREMTPLMERFNECVEEAWRSTTWGWCKWPTLTKTDLEFVAEIDQCIFDDGDYFLEQDPDFLGDSRKLQVLAMGRELAALSRDFWTRLHGIGAVPRLVREANHLFLLRECGEEIHEESSVYRDELAEAVLDYMPYMEKARAEGLDFWDVMKADVGGPTHESTGAFLIWAALTDRSIKDLKECLDGLVHRDEGRAQALFDSIASERAAESRARGWATHSAHRVGREVGKSSNPNSFVDGSFLAVYSCERRVATHSSSPVRTSTVIVSRRTGARRRQSHGAPVRTRGSRRTTGASPSGDPDESEPALGRLAFGFPLRVAVIAVVALGLLVSLWLEASTRAVVEVLASATTISWAFTDAASRIGGTLALVLTIAKWVRRRPR
jgi:hypothetical protein